MLKQNRQYEVDGLIVIEDVRPEVDVFYKSAHLIKQHVMSCIRLDDMRRI